MYTAPLRRPPSAWAPRTDHVQVDLVYDPTRQIHAEKPLRDEVRVDPLDEIMANKICTLVGRAEVRDFWDVFHLVERGQDLNIAIENASRKEGGVNVESLVYVLQSVDWPAFEAAMAEAGLSNGLTVAQYFQQACRDLATQLLPNSGK